MSRNRTWQRTNNTNSEKPRFFNRIEWKSIKMKQKAASARKKKSLLTSDRIQWLTVHDNTQTSHRFGSFHFVARTSVERFMHTFNLHKAAVFVHSLLFSSFSYWQTWKNNYDRATERPNYSTHNNNGMQFVFVCGLTIVVERSDASDTHANKQTHTLLLFIQRLQSNSCVWCVQRHRMIFFSSFLLLFFIAASLKTSNFVFGSSILST